MSRLTTSTLNCGATETVGKASLLFLLELLDLPEELDFVLLEDLTLLEDFDLELDDLTLLEDFPLEELEAASGSFTMIFTFAVSLFS